MLGGLLRNWGRSGSAALRHVVADVEPAAIYAIGDVHGRLDLLERIEAQIAADAERFAGERWIVLLGDFVDRGPRAAQVIDHLLSPPPPGLHRLCLMGNHERMMLDFVERPRAGAAWLGVGAEETLRSYGVPAEMLMRGAWRNRTARWVAESYIPEEHKSFLAGLPHLIETPCCLFAHAGLRPGTPPGRQRAADLLWYRDDFAEDFAEFGKTVVHGHAMRSAPLVTRSRIALDTGAYLTGILSAVRLAPGMAPELLATDHSVPPIVPRS